MDTFLGIGDIHFRSGDATWADRPEVRGDVTFAAEEILRVAVERQVKGIYLLGDVFNVRPQRSDVIDTVRAWLDRLCALCPVYYVQGQHELAEPPLLTAIHPETLHIDGVHVDGPDGLVGFGLDYRHDEHVEQALREVVPGDVDFLLTHQVWRDFMGEDRGSAWAAWSRCPTIVTGDYHRATSVPIETAGGAGVLYSPGPPCLHRFGEPTEHSVTLLGRDAQGGIFERVPIRSRRVLCFTVDAVEDLFAKKADVDAGLAGCELTPHPGVPPELEQAVVRIEIGPRLAPAEVRTVRREAQKLFHGHHLFFVPGKPPRRFDAEPGSAMVVEPDLTQEEAVRLAAADERVAADAVRILRAEDPAAEARAILDEALSLSGNRTA